VAEGALPPPNPWLIGWLPVMALCAPWYAELKLSPWLQTFGLDPITAAAIALLIALLPAAFLLSAGATAQDAPRFSRRLASAGLTLLLAPALVLHAHDPLATLELLIALALGWLGLWDVLSPPRFQPPYSERLWANRRMFGGVAAGVLAWLLALGLEAHGVLARVALAAALSAAAAPAWMLARRGDLRRPLLGTAALVASLLAFAPTGAVGIAATASVVALMCLSLEWLPADAPQDSASSWLDEVLVDPVRGITVTFLVGGGLGGLLLSVPAAASATSVPLLDALFTAFSAICVTGLAVVDTPTTYSGFGEAVILALIQVGGLGIMTFSSSFLLFMGQRMSVKAEAATASLVKARDRAQLRRVLNTILGVTFSIEAIGAVLLAGWFLWRGAPPRVALWQGVFTSVSAFCNAGFALQSDSLMGYAHQPFVLWVVGALITAGGLGPMVIVELVTRGRREPLSLQTRVILWTSTLLTGAGFIAFFTFEGEHTLANMGLIDRVSNALLQSVTLRTAGFNSVDLAAVHPATYAVMLPLMFVGGSPGSTAGGAKTTTAAVLVLVLRAALRGEDTPRIFGFGLDNRTIQKASAIAFLGFTAIATILLLLLLTQDMGFAVALYETVSALATVGLSIGGTARLDEVGKVLIILAMFAGRVGPLTLLMLLRDPHSTPRAGAPPLTSIDID